jgi:hypothetical protein
VREKLNHAVLDQFGQDGALAITGAKRHDSMLAEPILDGLSPVKGRSRGRPRRRPGKLHADKA